MAEVELTKNPSYKTAFGSALDARKAEMATAGAVVDSEECKKCVEFFANVAVVTALKAEDKLTMEHISKEYGITEECLNAYNSAAKYKYECGAYDIAENMLDNYLKVATNSAARWGRLASRILTDNVDGALLDLLAIKREVDETRSASPVEQLHMRAWVLHWSLFVVFRKSDRQDRVSASEFFNSRSYVQTMQNLCPWLLKYYTVSIISAPTKKSYTMREVMGELKVVDSMFGDNAFTNFVLSLYERFDFTAAQTNLKICAEQCKGDFFLKDFHSKFMHRARLLVCDAYCSMNRTVDLTTLSHQLELSEEEAERWMVDMVRSANHPSAIDARIDSTGKQVNMSAPTTSIHQDIAEFTRDLTLRSKVMCESLENILGDQAAFTQRK